MGISQEKTYTVSLDMKLCSKKTIRTIQKKNFCFFMKRGVLSKKYSNFAPKSEVPGPVKFAKITHSRAYKSDNSLTWAVSLCWMMAFGDAYWCMGGSPLLYSITFRPAEQGQPEIIAKL